MARINKLNILIDTHIYLWALAQPDKLNATQISHLLAMYNTIFVSAVTVAELCIKSSIGKLPLNFDPVDMAGKAGFELLSFSAHDAIRLKDLPFHHRDPFDRMLVAQSLQSDIPIMSNNHKFALYDCKMI